MCVYIYNLVQFLAHIRWSKNASSFPLLCDRGVNNMWGHRVRSSSCKNFLRALLRMRRWKVEGRDLGGAEGRESSGQRTEQAECCLGPLQPPFLPTRLALSFQASAQMSDILRRAALTSSLESPLSTSPPVSFLSEHLPNHNVEEEMATHSSVLAWRIPGAGEPGGLPSLGSHKSWTRLKRPSSSSNHSVSSLRSGLYLSFHGSVTSP